MNDVLFLLVGLVLGGAVGWLLGSRRPVSAPADQRVENELRQQLIQRDNELSQARGQITQLTQGRTAAETNQSAAEERLAEQQLALKETAAAADDLRAKLSQTAEARATAEARLAAAERLLADQRQAYDENLRAAKQAQEKALADLRDAFKALSADALKQTQPEFLRLANETLAKFQESAKGDLEKRQESIATLVKPLEEQLKTYQQRLQQSDTAQSAALGEVKKHLETLAQQSQSLSSETLQLRRVLSSNQARGRWGEETLRRVVEAAGMSAHCDFTEQAQADDKKPDLVVRLPGERVIIVDSKVPGLEFLAALDEADTTKRAEALAAHASRLKSTIKELGDRDYPSQFPNALDYVVLFLPAESLFSAALEGDRDLIVWAAQKRIMLATPASLIALLRSVSVSWQQYAQTENARAIAAAAQEFFARVVKFTEHFERIRSGLERAQNAYNDAVGSYERLVRPSGERLEKLGGGSPGKELADAQPLEASLRLPPVAEGADTAAAGRGDS
ncbi:MAG: DNA recombination protein RmuC [Verrucomicrobia bacterium]|nr:DNA recombination protein RmuC [Verrucomicrobiota bacterium]